MSTTGSKKENGSSTDNVVCLKKNIGVSSCVGLVVGAIIGSGIFISPRGVLLGTGSVGLTLVVWAICGSFAFMGAWSVTELGLLLPNSGGEYIYLLESFAPNRKEVNSYFGPLVGFLYIWMYTIFMRPSAVAVQALACSSYLVKLFALDCLDKNADGESLEVKLIAAAVVILISAINCYSVNASTKIINLLTMSKVFALLLIVIGGIVTFTQGTSRALNSGFEGTELGLGGIALAFYSGLWAFSGWDNLNLITREIIRPEKNLPKALAISCSLVTILYLLVNISYFIVMTKAEFLASSAVAVDYSSKLLGSFGATYMVFSVALSIFGSSTSGSFTSIRATYAAARENQLIDILAYLHIRHMSPSVAIIFSTVLSLLVIANSTILSMIFLLGFIDSIFFSILMVSLLILRKTKKDAKRPVKVPTVFPVIVMAFSLFLMVTPLVTRPTLQYLYVILLLATGVIVYTIFVFYKFRIAGLENMKKFIQVILEVAPPEDKDI